MYLISKSFIILCSNNSCIKFLFIKQKHFFFIPNKKLYKNYIFSLICYNRFTHPYCIRNSIRDIIGYEGVSNIQVETKFKFVLKGLQLLIGENYYSL